MSAPELLCDDEGRWWVVVDLADGMYGTTHGTRKRKRVPVYRGADEETAKTVAKGMGLLDEDE